MTLLIDAFNLIYKFDDLEDLMYAGHLARARQGLLEKLIASNALRKKPLEFIVFVDGKKMPGSEVRSDREGPIPVLYSHDLSADYLIRSYIEKSGRPRDFLVISSDKKIREHARASRCKSQASEDFAREIQNLLKTKEEEGAEKQENLSADEIAYWARLFGKK